MALHIYTRGLRQGEHARASSNASWHACASYASGWPTPGAPGPGRARRPQCRGMPYAWPACRPGRRGKPGKPGRLLVARDERMAMRMHVACTARYETSCGCLSKAVHGAQVASESAVCLLPLHYARSVCGILVQHHRFTICTPSGLYGTVSKRHQKHGDHK